MYDRLAIDLKHIKEELVGIQARLQTMYDMETKHLAELESKDEDTLDLEFQVSDLESALSDMESLLEGVENVLENQGSS